MNDIGLHDIFQWVRVEESAPEVHVILRNVMRDVVSNAVIRVIH